jgi:hypothetical protein
MAEEQNEEAPERCITRKEGGKTGSGRMIERLARFKRD